MKMGMVEKYAFGEARVRNLVFGIILVFGAIALVLFVYGALLGKFSGVDGAEVVITDPEGFVSGLVAILLLILFLGVGGGFEIGRYVQTEFTKRRKERQE